MNGTHAQSPQFLSNIRGYNSALSMASSGGMIANPPTGISMFAVRGRMYHLIGPPHPLPGQAPRFAQLYIVDGGNQVQARLQHFHADDLHPELLASLQTLLMEHNHYVQQYIQVKKWHFHVYLKYIAYNNNSYRFRVLHQVCLPGSRSKTVHAMRCETCRTLNL